MALLQENKRVKVKTSCSGQSVSFPFKAALQRLLKDVVLAVVVSELSKPHAVSLDMLEQQGAEKFDTQIACPCKPKWAPQSLLHVVVDLHRLAWPTEPSPPKH